MTVRERERRDAAKRRAEHRRYYAGLAKHARRRVKSSRDPGEVAYWRKWLRSYGCYGRYARNPVKEHALKGLSELWKVAIPVITAYTIYTLTRPKVTPATQAALADAKASGATPAQMAKIGMDDPKVKQASAEMQAEGVSPTDQVSKISNMLTSVIGAVK